MDELTPAAPRIDAHHHVWDLAVRDQPWTEGTDVLRRSFSFADLRPALDRHGIDRTVLVQTVTVADETPELLALAAGEPRIAGVVGWVDLEATDVADALGRLLGNPGGQRLVGIRHQVQEEPDPEWLRRPAVHRGLCAVGAAGLAYDLLVIVPQLAAALDAAAACPDTTFVLDHAGNPPVATGEMEPWRTSILALARHDNVACKLSGLVTQADHGRWTVKDLRPFTDTVLEGFGVDRVLFGSDWPACLPAADYDRVVAAAAELVAGCSREERAAVFGGNARAWYRLGER